MAKNKLKLILALSLAVVISIVLLTIVFNEDVREGIGIVCIIIGCDMLNPIPSLDWIYFIIPVAVMISVVYPHNSKVIILSIAYALSMAVGALLIAVGVALLGSGASDTVNSYINYMTSSTFFIIYVVVSVLIFIVILYYANKYRAFKEVK